MVQSNKRENGKFATIYCSFTLKTNQSWSFAYLCTQQVSMLQLCAHRQPLSVAEDFDQSYDYFLAFKTIYYIL